MSSSTAMPMRPACWAAGGGSSSPVKRYGKDLRKRLELEEGNDELVIVFDPDPREAGPPYNQQNATCLHLEQMEKRDWYLGIGDLKFNIHVKEETGAIELMLYDGEETKFTDSRSGVRPSTSRGDVDDET